MSLLRRRWRSAAALGLIAAAAGAVSIMLAIGLANREPATGRSGLNRVGKPAEPFTLQLLGGGEFALPESPARPAVINFWASWCAPCREEAPILERAWRTYEGEVAFVGVNIQDAREGAAAYLDEFGITYPNGMDVDGRITVDYGVIGLPVTFFVGADGVVKRRWVGPIGEAELLARVDELATGAVRTDVDGEGDEEALFRLE